MMDLYKAFYFWKKSSFILTVGLPPNSHIKVIFMLSIILRLLMYGRCSHFTINFLLIGKFGDMFLLCCILIYMLLHCTKNVFILVKQLCIVI